MSEDLTARLAAAEAARDAARARREAVEAEREALRSVEVAERDAADEVALADAIEAHGLVGVAIATVATAAGLVIVKRPRAADYRRLLERGSQKVEDMERIVRPCVIHPRIEAFDRITEDYPALLPVVALQVVELAEAARRERDGKL